MIQGWHNIKSKLRRLIGPLGLMGLIGPLGLVGCTAEEETAAGAARPIALTAYTSQPVTRADSALLAVETIPVGQSIGVYAYYHDNSTWTDDDEAMPQRTSPNFMFNQRAVNTGVSQAFSYSPLKYWPNEEADKLSFIAYYPYCNGAADDGSANDIASTGVTPNMVNSDTGLPTFSFSVKDNVKEQVDFMVSRLIADVPTTRDTEADPHEPFNDLTINDRVRFYFLHATAKIEFGVRVDAEVRDKMAYFTLKGITLTNIYSRGDLTPTVSLDGEGNLLTTLDWSSHSTPHDYSCKTTEAYLLLPQTLPDESNLTVSYDLAFKSEGTTYTYVGTTPVATEEYAYTDRTTTVQLNTLKLTASDTPITEWLPGHHYVYILHIKPNAIYFTGQVVEWGDEEELEMMVEE